MKHGRWIQAAACLVAVAALAMIGGCGGGGGSSGPSGPASWTYMVYMAGDNNLSEAAITDLLEMETVGSDANVNIIVQVEFSSQYTPGVPTDTLRGRITTNSNLTRISNVDMGAKQTLTDFIGWAAANYPADNYALVLWDHGAGWKVTRRSGGAIRGALQDETSGSFMSLPDIADAVRVAGIHFDVINFDACLMAMHEVAYEFNGLADYLVASEDSEPGEGDPYDRILGHLKATPGMSGQQLASTIVQDYVAYYRDNYPASGARPIAVTKSAIDLSQIAMLHANLTDLAQTMISKIGTERANIQAARDAAISYDFPTNRDLGDFLNRLAINTNDATLDAKVAAARAALGIVVTANATYASNSAALTNSQGLAIFLPSLSQVTNDELAQYALLASSSGTNDWADFINVLLTGDSGSPLEKTAGNFVFWLEWNTVADLDLMVLEPDGTWAAPFLGSSSPNGFLSADSAISGVSAEYYAAAEQVAKGDYDIVVNYWDANGSTGSTTARLYFYDAEDPNFTDFVEVGNRAMDLSYPAPNNATWADMANDVYSDWWIPGTLTRTQPEQQVQTFILKGHTVRITVLPDKTKREHLPYLDRQADTVARQRMGRALQ